MVNDIAVIRGKLVNYFFNTLFTLVISTLFTLQLFPNVSLYLFHQVIGQVYARQKGAT